LNVEFLIKNPFSRECANKKKEMKMKDRALIEECRDSGVPCGNSACEFYDLFFDQQCRGIVGEIESFKVCKKYAPIEGEAEAIVKRRDLEKKAVRQKKFGKLKKLHKHVLNLVLETLLVMIMVFTVLWMKGRWESVELEKDDLRGNIKNHTLNIEYNKLKI
jgi:cell division protein FtsL